MKKILAIETSGDICGAALISAGKVIAEKNVFFPKNSSSKIFDILGFVTKKDPDFNAIAVDIGPGSFTGIRIGISLARIYGQMLKLPVAGVSSLDCIVFNALKSRKIPGKIFPVIDALRDEVYTAEYEGLKKKSGYRTIKIEKFRKILDNESTVAGAAEICKKISAEKSVVAGVSASAVGLLALNKFKKNNYSDVLPLYVRMAFAEERRKKMENKIEIRRVRQEDIKTIASIERVSHPEPWSEKMFADELNVQFSNFFAALVDGAIAGYVCFWSIDGESQITNITVAEKLRRKGLGFKLMKYAVEYAAGRLNSKKMFLEARADNKAALGLYGKFGFKKIGIRKKYYSNAGDAVVMEKIL